MEMRAGEMLTLGSGHQIHSRTDGLCHWGAIRIPAEELSQYARALSGGSFGLPPVARWRPQRAALRQLRHLHQAAVRTAKAQSGVLADKEAVHGLEQQIIHALVESLSPGPIDEETETACRHRHILARFEVLLEAHPLASTTEIGAALGVSDRMLRECCRKSLGMGPSRYRRLRGMQLVYYTLRHEDRPWQACRRSHADTVSSILDASPRAIAPFTANCLRLPCGDTTGSQNSRWVGHA